MEIPKYIVKAVILKEVKDKGTKFIYEETEAIPIEWLKNWEKEHTWEYETYFREVGKYVVECVIEDWRKENEKNRT